MPNSHENNNNDIPSQPPGVRPDIHSKPSGAERKIVGKVSMNRAILRISLPTMAGWYLQIAFNIVDAFWVGKLGPAALAAVGASNFALWAVYTLADIFSVGSAAIISRRIGEERFEEATRIAGRIIPTLIVGSALIGVMGLLTVDKLYEYINASPEATRFGIDYMTIILMGTPLLFFTMWFESIFHANSDAKTPMKIFAAALVLNTVLSPALIFGWGFFPRMEVAGAAIGTVFSQVIASIVGIIIMRRRGLIPKELKGYRPSFKLSKKVVKIGGPSSITGFLFCIIYIYIARVAAQFGDEPLAALAIGHRMEEMAWVPCAGLYMAAVSVVGQYLGSKDKLGAMKSGWRSWHFGLAFTGFFGLVFFFGGKWLVLPFSSDAKVLALGADYLRINAPALIFMASGIILSGAMAGAGATIMPMLITVPIIALRIPMSVYFAENLGYGATGIWWALALSSIVRGMLMIAAYSRGKWLKKVV